MRRSGQLAIVLAKEKKEKKNTNEKTASRNVIKCILKGPKSYIFNSFYMLYLCREAYWTCGHNDN